MEGTRNERVVILLIAYIIGFVTAYIAFGVVQLGNDDAVNTASVISSQRNDPNAVFLAIDKEGLILIKNNKRTLLSALEEPSSNTFFEEGQHVAIVDYSLSPDKANVYFCELPSTDSDSCRPYIYSIKEDIVYPVTVDGERVAFDAENQSTSWSKTGELIVN